MPWVSVWPGAWLPCPMPACSSPPAHPGLDPRPANFLRAQTPGFVTWSVFSRPDSDHRCFPPDHWACRPAPHLLAGVRTEDKLCPHPNPPEATCESQAALCFALTFPSETLVTLALLFQRQRTQGMSPEANSLCGLGQVSSPLCPRRPSAQGRDWLTWALRMEASPCLDS